MGRLGVGEGAQKGGASPAQVERALEAGPGRTEGTFPRAIAGDGRA